MGDTQMRREIEEIPAAARRFLTYSRAPLRDAGAALRRIDPVLVSTVARGSSDHAAGYLKYIVEMATGVPVASLGPSVVSIYRRRLRLAQSACIGISQSGRSPDIVDMMTGAREGGALAIAITNATESPLAAACDISLPLHAGPERSVAATKTFVSSVAASLALCADWTGDAALSDAVAALPDQFEAALGCDWKPLSDRLARAPALYVLGRGPGYAIANEMALKFKETCALHASAYSAAEVLHGPAAIVRSGFPVLALAVDDAAAAQVTETSERLAQQGADVFLTRSGGTGTVTLPSVPDVHPMTAPLVLAVSFYGFVEALARRRGLDPDAPPYLQKVTETV